MFWPSHPAAEIYPMMPESELQALAEDIKANGQKHKIVLFRGQILDGRNRAKACEMAGVRPEAISMAACASPVDYVRSMNHLRRHMTASQRSMVAAATIDQLKAEAEERRASTLKKGAGSPLAPIGAIGKTSEILALAEGVPARSIERAARVMHEGAPSLSRAVRDGDVAVGAAEGLVELPLEEQERVVAAGPKAVRAKAKEIRETKSRAANDEKAKPESNPDFERVVTAVMKFDVGQLKRLASVVNGLLKDRDRSAS